jgi:hypothetical protein
LSQNGDCYDNSAKESWNDSFKVDAIRGERFLTRKEAKHHILNTLKSIIIANGFIQELVKQRQMLLKSKSCLVRCPKFWGKISKKIPIMPD